MTVEEFLADMPMLHSWDGGRTWNSGGFEPEQLRALHGFLLAHLPPGARTLETGAGNTTITLMLLRPSRHVAICPDATLFDRIRVYCVMRGIGLEPLDARVDLSEWQLPGLAEETRGTEPTLDLAIIDGGHNYPQVFLDFFYANFMLKRGGFLLVDDLQLHPCKELGRMLAEQPDFEAVLDLGKSMLFRKTTAARDLGDWSGSPYVARLSEENMRLPNPFALESYNWEREARELAREVARLRPKAEEATRHLDALHRSTSWRVTAPLRAVRRMLGSG